MKMAGRWNIWHLSALVAGSALVLAVIARTPITMIMGVGVCAWYFVPPFWVAFALDRRIRVFMSMDPQPRNPGEALMVKLVWFGVLLVFHTILSTALLGVLLLLWIGLD
jgi:hypothetical protein